MIVFTNHLEVKLRWCRICAEWSGGGWFIAYGWSQMVETLEWLCIYAKWWEVKTEVIVSVLCHAGVNVWGAWFEVTASSCAATFWKSGADVCADSPAILADGISKLRVSGADSINIRSADSPETCEKTNLYKIIVQEHRNTPIIADFSDSRWIMISVWAVFVIVNTADSSEHVVLVLDACWRVVCVVMIVSSVGIDICDIHT